MTISLCCERCLCNDVHYIDKFTTLYSESKSTVNVTIRYVVMFTTLFLQCMNTVPSDYIPNSYLSLKVDFASGHDMAGTRGGRS